MQERFRQTLILAATALGLLVLGRWATHEPLSRTAEAAWPDPDELTVLSSHLGPAEAVLRPVAGPRLDDLPDPFDRWRAAPAPPPVLGAPDPPRPSWSVSAILITDRRRVAVVNDRLVGPGDLLPGGARVAGIERDRITVVEPGGSTRVLRLESEEAR